MKQALFCVCFVTCSLFPQAQVRYTLRYQDSTAPVVSVRIETASPIQGPVRFIMPRSIPGAYAISRYEQFIEDIAAFTSDGRRMPMTRDEQDAPRWVYDGLNEKIAGVEYKVNIDRMERQNTPSDASLLRPGFAGILNYSVFGWIEGYDWQPVACRIETFSAWPVFSTQAPSTTMARGSLVLQADDYPALADGQLFMGPRVRVKSFPGKVPLYVASYAQTADEYLDDYGSIGVECLKILEDYFGDLPFRHYTLVMSKSLQPDNRISPAFAMEHRISSTFFGDTTGLQQTPMSPGQRMRRKSSILHHMAHAYIPLRAYAGKYQPRPLEIPPLMETIWMNEGFAWFLLYDTLKLQYLPDMFRAAVFNTAPEIKALSLVELSYLASTLYAVDFRTGRAIFSRGALMAMEMDRHIRSQTAGKKGMRDVVRYLYQHAKTNPLPIPVDQLPVLMSRACGVELDGIYRKWQGRVE